MYSNSISGQSSINRIHTLSNSIQKSFSHIASGSRLSVTGSDPAGVQISSAMQSQMRGMDAAMNNIQHGRSALQTADGNLGQIKESLQRVRSNLVAASNGTNNAQNIAAYDQQIQADLAGIDQMAESSNFNDLNLLDGSAGAVNIQTGPTPADTITLNSEFAGATSTDLGLGGMSIASSADAQAAIANVDAALEQISTQQGTIGASSSALESHENFVMVQKENMAAANSRVYDMDMAEASTRLVREQFQMQASVKALAMTKDLNMGLLDLLK